MTQCRMTQVGRFHIVAFYALPKLERFDRVRVGRAFDCVSKLAQGQRVSSCLPV